jgi:hypothetical protein
MASNYCGKMDWWADLIPGIEKAFGGYYKSDQAKNPRKVSGRRFRLHFDDYNFQNPQEWCKI